METVFTTAAELYDRTSQYIEDAGDGGGCFLVAD